MENELYKRKIWRKVMTEAQLKEKSKHPDCSCSICGQPATICRTHFNQVKVELEKLKKEIEELRK